MSIILSILIPILVKANIIVIGVLISFFIIEKTTSLKLIIKDFRWKKSNKNANTIKYTNTFLYFIINLAVLIYHIWTGYINVEGIKPFGIHTKPLTNWFIILGLWYMLVNIFIKCILWYHNNYQGLDLSKKDDDYLDAI